MQAADLLAVQCHIQEVCSALAARLFATEPRSANKRSEDRAAQVRFCTLEKRLESLVAKLSADMNSS
jgi:hypothetical protein